MPLKDTTKSEQKISTFVITVSSKLNQSSKLELNFERNLSYICYLQNYYWVIPAKNWKNSLCVRFIRIVERYILKHRAFVLFNLWAIHNS